MNEYIRNQFSELRRIVVLLVLMAPIAACSLVPSRIAPERQTCGSLKLCTPEEALDASIQALRTNGDSLLLGCGMDRANSEALIQSCRERAGRVVARLASNPALDVVTMDPVEVSFGQECVDSFVPGNEASDCAFYSYDAKLTLRWR